MIIGYDWIVEISKDDRISIIAADISGNTIVTEKRQPRPPSLVTPFSV